MRSFWRKEHPAVKIQGQSKPSSNFGLPMNDVTLILSAIEQGDPHAAEQLLPLVYQELRRLAGEKMAEEKPGQTLQATALVHEAYLRLVEVEQAQHWNSRGHFFAAAGEAMRRILIDGARRKKAAKAGGDWQRQELIDEALAIDSTSDDLFAVDAALSRLSENRPRCRGSGVGLSAVWGRHHPRRSGRHHPSGPSGRLGSSPNLPAAVREGWRVIFPLAAGSDPVAAGG